MKSKLIWFVIIAAAITVAGWAILWMNRRWREEDKARARLQWSQRQQHAEDLQRINWENRRLIGFNNRTAPCAS